MIINYDKNPALTVNDRLQSLVESMQLALNEIETHLDEIDKSIKELKEGNRA
jgi:hypothetical protein